MGTREATREFLAFENLARYCAHSRATPDTSAYRTPPARLRPQHVLPLSFGFRQFPLPPTRRC